MNMWIITAAIINTIIGAMTLEALCREHEKDDFGEVDGIDIMISMIPFLNAYYMYVTIKNIRKG